MKNLLTLALSTAFAAQVATAAAEPEFYWGANYSSFQAAQTDPSLNPSFSVQTLEGLVGANIYPYISVEGRAGVGINDDRELVDAVQFELVVPYTASIYFRPYIENDKASLYGLIGASIVGFDVTNTDTDEESSDSESGLSLGVGVSFTINKKADFRAEWRSLVNSDAADVHGATVGFTYSF